MLLRLLVILTTLGAYCGVASAQGDWPNKPVRIIVPWPAGGSADIVGRLLAERLSVTLRQNFIVENRPGASGMIGSAVVANAEPDGYTFLISGIPSQVIAPVISETPTFDTMKDFTHIAFIGGSPTAIVAHSSLGVKTLSELIALAKNRSAPLAYVSPGVGSLGNLVAEVLAEKEHIKLVHVPYKGGAQAVTDLIAGHVKLGSMTWSATQNHIRSGVLIPLAVTSSRKIPNFEDVPTFQELKYSELTTTAWWAFSGPAKLPRHIVQTLNREIVNALDTPAIRAKLTQEAIETENMTPEQFTNFVGAEIKKWGPVAKRAMNISDKP